ncbi:SAM-dependent methyltransferase [Leptospira perolatii]|uniref:SAM-dependent methyltransferase n=1 Tax=Leptospira perolatii TaxID=2023191 RepID=A0A2M9ZQW4_9LEPT|nr:class I SAM-dependent methyltransferase [Leptospira perolatii]PJZ70576.1 SAM-dependent methyltransferase [Leptospira perolatii]PJZ74470.1 SAM-dependent methyltransferase [Leptospira perolatii]
MKEECALDGACEWKPHYTSSFSDFQLPIFKCDTCGLQAQFPRPKAEELYTEEYYTGSEGFTYKDERKTEFYDRYVWIARLKNIGKWKSSGNFLDIGCSFGGFLNCAKELGFSPFGVEVSAYAAQACTARGIKVWNSHFLDADLPENFFDVITLVEVIEHLENPRAVFDKLEKILKPGGLLVLQTANFEGWQAKDSGPGYHYYLPGHLYYYSESNLRKILANRNFESVITYLGVDFSLIAKLKKSRGSFKSWKDYLRWISITKYHFLSKIKKSGFPLTSSMVIYAVKKGET